MSGGLHLWIREGTDCRNGLRLWIGKEALDQLDDEMALRTVQAEPRGSQKAVNVAQPGKALPVVCVAGLRPERRKL